MMIIAPRSSKIASVSKNTFNDTGARLPTSARIPSAKAMSVAAGMAQPLIVSGLPQLNATKTKAGTIMPPTAAMPGNKTSAGFLSLPSSNSRFNSKPIRKKKIAIKPSLIHKINGFPKPSPFRVIEKYAERKVS